MVDNFHDNKNFEDVKWFDDIFDILDDDGDGDTTSNEEREKILREYNQDFDFDYIDTNVDEEEMITEDDTKTGEEQVLSQKFGQLLTKDESDHLEEYFSGQNKRSLSTPSTPDIISKKMRVLDEFEQQEEQIPAYLQTTSKIFRQWMSNHILNINAATILTEDNVQQLAILKHKIAAVSLEKKLWTVYLKSSMGQWKTEESSKTNVIDRRLWPIQVKKLLSSKLKKMDVNEATDDQKMCENLVHEHLQEIDRTIEEYHHEFDQMKQHCINLTDEMEKAIELLVQQHGIPSLQMKLNYKIATLQYEYDAQLLEREYLRLEPTEDQIQLARRLFDLRYKYLQAKQKLIELKQRILCNKPTELISSVSLPIPTSVTDPMIMDEKVRQRLFDRRVKEAQDKLTDSMIVSIIDAEDTIQEYRQLFDDEILQLSVDGKDDQEKLKGKQIDLIYRHFKIIDKHLQHIKNFRINYFLRTRHEDIEDEINKASAIGFSPTMIIDTSSHRLTDEQLKLLNRGPTYVPFCQMYVSSSYVSIDDMLQKQYKVLQHHLMILLAKFHLNTAQSMFISKEIKDAFISVFSMPLPPTLHQRAVYEKQLVQSIREHIKANDLILRRTADDKNVFYLGNRKDFEEKANEYMTKTAAFEVCEIVDETNLQKTRHYLNTTVHAMNSTLEAIFNNKKIHKDILQKLFIYVDKVQLPYLYFLPEVSWKKNDISLKPVVVSQCSATSRLAQFLDKLLRPVIQRHAQATTFVNGADFIRKLNQYTEDKHRFYPNTIFNTINMPNLHMMVPHQTMLNTLKDYLDEQLIVPCIENIPMNKIIYLTGLFLRNNRFYYQNKIYRFTKGSPSSFLFTETLSNIYVLQLQQVLLREPALQNEFYGRCKNQIFFTWNDTVNKFRQLLQTTCRKYPDVQRDAIMGSEIQFLNMHIENLNGTLYSRVYHDPNVQKYTLPYVIGDAKGAHSHWFRSALIRAVRYCTSVYDFNQERIYLEMTCLANGYSVEFIERRTNHFFTHFNATSLRLSLDQTVYERLRHRLFNLISEQHHLWHQNQELEKKNQQVRLSYLYQFGPKKNFDMKLQEILSRNLATSAEPSASNTKKIKIILTTKQRHSLNALLSQQKPFHQLLNNEKSFL